MFRVEDLYLSLKEKFTNSIEYRTYTFFVVVPILLITCYMYIFMEDRFISNAIISVKDSSLMGQESNFLGGISGFSMNGSSNTIDENILQAFIHSPGILKDLDSEYKLKDHYSDTRDFIFGLSINDSFEDFLEFYRNRISIQVKPQTNLLQLGVESYSSEYSYQIANAILKKSEKFINDMDKKIAIKEMKFADDEIDHARSKLKKATLNLLNFQNANKLFNPDIEGDSVLSIISKLESELSIIEYKINQHENYMRESAPFSVALRNQSEAIKKEITNQKLKITGIGNEDIRLNNLSKEFKSLSMDLDIAIRVYEGAVSAFESSRVGAIKNLKHFVLASEAQISEEPLLPNRPYWFLTFFIILNIIWFIANLLIKTIYEHND